MNLFLNVDINSGATWNKGDYLLLAARRLGLDNVKRYLGEDNPEYVLNIEPFLSRKYVAGSKWSGVWEIDLSLDRQETSLSDWAASRDVFIAISHIPSRFECLAHKTRLLYQACDPIVHRRIPDIKQEYDFVFCGSLGTPIYEERTRVMKLLKEKFSFRGYPKNNTIQQYVKYINTARVQFIRSGGGASCPNSTAQRFFECLAIGPVLTDWSPDLTRTGLIEDEDFLSYKNDFEMAEKMRFLIENPDEAERIANNGRRKALLYHTYEHRLISIINTIREYDPTFNITS